MKLYHDVGSFFFGFHVILFWSKEEMARFIETNMAVEIAKEYMGRMLFHYNVDQTTLLVLGTLSGGYYLC